MVIGVRVIVEQLDEWSVAGWQGLDADQKYKISEKKLVKIRS